MYKIKDAKWGDLIEEITSPVWVRQQERVDLPICCDSYEEADGLVLGDGNTMVGIAGRNMENYKPLVVVEEVSGEPYLMARINDLENELRDAKQERQAIKDDNLALMMGVADLYAAVTNVGGGA